MTMSNTGPISADRLKSFVERIERMEEERKAIGGDIRDIYSEAKGVGYDVKTLRKVVQLRKMDAADRDEQEQLLDVYWHALTTVDRIEARAAAGESAREIAAAEGVSKSTAHRVSQKAHAGNANTKSGHADDDSATGNSAHEGEEDEQRDQLRQRTDIQGHDQGSCQGSDGRDATYQQHLDSFRRTPDRVFEAAERAKTGAVAEAQPERVAAPTLSKMETVEIDLTIPAHLDRRIQSRSAEG